MGRPKGSRNKKTLERLYGQQVRREAQSIPQTYGSKDNFVRYESVSAMMAATATAVRSQFADLYSGVEWAGGRSLPEAVEYMRKGATHEEMKEALDLINKVDASFRDREVTVWQPSICGAYPIVAEYLMGLPESMRMRKPIESQISPMRFIIEPVVSQGITHQQMRRRGAAIAALLMRTVEERPVELYMFHAGSDTDGRGGRMGTQTWMTRFDSTPVSLSQVVAAFSASFARMVALTHLYVMSGRKDYAGGSWGNMGHPDFPGGARDAKLRKTMGLNPQDVLIQAGYLPDAGMMDRDPVAWVHKQLEKQRSLDV